jgi:hypothetical protein
LLHGSAGVFALGIVSVVVVIGMILAYKANRRDPKTHRTRLGIYIERDRFEEEDEKENEQ